MRSMTTLGAERQFTYAYHYDDEAEFVQAIMEEMPAPPPYYPAHESRSIGSGPIYWTRSP